MRILSQTDKNLLSSSGYLKSESDLTKEQKQAVYSYSDIFFSRTLKTGIYGRELVGDKRGNQFIQSDTLKKNVVNQSDKFFKFFALGGSNCFIFDSEFYGKILLFGDIKLCPKYGYYFYAALQMMDENG